ncbi:hypothetical protein EIN_397060 [Entamoeba invadens IP1]|uniref:CXXC-rich protein n=1 Tax=Entamoeba invadens IP1 TaxID=370355 RepID=A0A0A1UDF5_ENTIV|nr:hypothetical protein EIN_397060 [Entamoeba invadens IP1]ELP91846.1 hypothetical protein EIN_397060 [Entamoeba invadens IP1]|eukprot:XP_004258617.1 hypothetical protein EIN_397060 [Entamoeba invadens IP1]
MNMLSILFMVIFSYSNEIGAHCKVVTEDECTICSHNYILSNTKECIPISDIHCSQVDYSHKYCMKCYPGFRLSIDTMKCIFGDEFCAQYYVNEKNVISCSSCFFEFTLIDSQRCENCSFINSGCYLATGDCSNCTQCGTNYYLDNGKCIKLKNCKSNDERDTKRCLECIPGYYLDENTYICHPGNISKCLVYSSNTNCFVCETGLVQIGNKCTKIEHCIESDMEQCTQCDEKYSLQNNKCVKCLDDNCVYCDTNISKCEHCEKGFNLTRGGDCVFCNSSEGYHFYNDKCIRCNYECQNCDLRYPEICTSCYDGFVLNNGKCLKCGDGCKRCDPEYLEMCVGCVEQYVMLKDRCIKCEGSCSTCDPNNLSQCIECISNYYLDLNTNKCISCDELICEGSDKMKCTSCLRKCREIDEPYFKCINISCVEYDTSRSVCTDCADSYYLDDSYRCVKCADICDTQNGCVKTKDTCINPHRINNCAIETEDKKCKYCAEHYVKKGETQCVFEAYCYSFNDDCECTSCFDEVNGSVYLYVPYDNGRCKTDSTYGQTITMVLLFLLLL